MLRSARYRRVIRTAVSASVVLSLSIGAAASVAGPAAAEVPTIDGEKRLSVVRSEFSNDYVNVDGTHTAVLSLEPLNVADGKGGFTPIDTAIRAAAGGDLTTGKHRLKPKFARKAAAGSTVSFGTTGGAVSFGLVGSRPVRPVKLGKDGVRYRNVLPGGVDLDYKVLKSEVKEELVVRERSKAAGRAGSSWQFVYRAPGLTASKTADGGVVFKNRAGRTVGAIPAGQAWDSAAKPSVVDVSYTLGRRGKDTTLTVSVDPAWAASAKRVYPLHIDPSYTDTYGSSTSFQEPAGPGCVTSETMRCGIRVGNNYDSTDSYWRTSAHFQYEKLFGTRIDAVEINMTLNRTATSRDYGHPLYVYPTASMNFDGQGSPELARAVMAVPTVEQPATTLAGPELTRQISDWVKDGTSGQSLFFIGRQQSRTHSYNDLSPLMKITYTVTGTPPPDVEPDPEVPPPLVGGITLAPTTAAPAAIRSEVCINATVKTSAGALIQDAAVTFTVTGANTASELVQSGSNGVARFCYRGTRLGRDTVRATAGGKTASVTRTWSAAVPAARTFGFQKTCAYVGDPVNTATGNFVSEALDVAGPAGVDGLDITRTYNSLDEGDGVFGRGWTSVLDSTIDASDPTIVEYRAPDGRIVRFTGDGASYARVEELTADLTAVGEGYVLVFDDGRRVSFGADGKVSGWSFWDGQAVTLNHSDDGRTAILTSSLGAAMTVTFNEAGLVQTVRSDDGRQASYEHTNGALRTVTDPAGGTTRYTTDDAGRITRFTDGAGVVQGENTYDAYGRVATQGSPAATTLRFEYGTGTTTVTDTQDGSQLIYRHDSMDRSLSVEDPLGKVLTKSYDERGNLTAVTDRVGATAAQTYDAHGNLLSSTERDGSVLRYSYDSADRLVTETTPGGATTSYTYTGAARIPSTVTEANGAVTTYDVAGGLVRRVTDPDGVSRTYAYDARRRVVATTDGLGRTTRATYDGMGNRTSVTTPSGARTLRSFDGLGRLLSETDPLGAITRTSYDGAGRVLAVTDATGAITRSAYDSVGRLATETDGNGQVTSHEYDSLGRLVKTVAPGGAATKTEYGSLSRVASTTDPTGAVTRYTYDENGRQVAVTDALGHSTAETLDDRGRVTSRTDELGRTTRYTYDRDDRMTAETDAAGAVTRYEYDAVGQLTATLDRTGARRRTAHTPAGRVSTETDGTGRVTSYSYDDAGQLAARTSPGGGATTFGYDADGQPTRTRTAGGLVTTYQYDAAGQLIAATEPGRGTLRRSYTARGELATVVDGLGATRSFVYDAVGNQVAVTAPNGATTRFEYDGRGNTVRRTASDGATERYSYDAADRRLSRTDALGRVESTSYDLLGRVVAAHDASGRSVSSSYDAAGQLTKQTAGDGSTRSYTYDAVGRQVSAADERGTSTFEYDAEGRLVARRAPSGRTLKYTYDADGRKLSMTRPDGSTDTFSYNSEGDLAGVAHKATKIAYEYDADGRLVVERLPDGKARRRSYTNGLLSGYQQDGSTYQAGAVIERDAVGRRTKETRSDAVEEYEYDEAGQLTGYDNTTVRYDASGRRTAVVSGNKTTTYTYDDAGQLLRTSDGNKTTTYSYDGAGRRTREDDGQSVTTTAYDAWGQRSTTTTVKGRNSSTTRFTHDIDGSLVAVSDDKTRTDIEWDNELAVPQPITLISDGAETLLLNGTNRAAAISGDKVSVFNYDSSGSTQRSGDSLNLADAQKYDPWGEPGGDSNNGLVRLGYRGELTIEGLVHLRARDYEPTSGQFTTVDPLEGVAGEVTVANAYAYSANDPLNLMDPLGERPICSSKVADSAISPRSLKQPTRTRVLGVKFVQAAPAPAEAGLGPFQAMYCAGLHAGACASSLKISRYALALTQQLRRAGSLRNEAESNAFRHIYWMARTSFLFGPRFAEGLGTAHEHDTILKNPDNREVFLDSLNDMVNNRIGANLGFQMRNPQTAYWMSRIGLPNYIVGMIATCRHSKCGLGGL